VPGNIVTQTYSWLGLGLLPDGWRLLEGLWGGEQRSIRLSRGRADKDASAADEVSYVLGQFFDLLGLAQHVEG